MKFLSVKTRVLLFLFFILFIHESKAQSRGLQYRQISTIDLVIGGDFGFRLISSNAEGTKMNQSLENRDQFESYKLNYRYGFNYNHGLTPDLLIKTGLRFANPGFSISSIDKIDPEQDINFIQKTYRLQGPEYRYSYQMIEIPLGLKYVFPKSVCSPYVEAGVSTSFYQKTIVEERPYEGRSNRTTINEKINKVNFIANLAAGGDFVIADKLSGFSQLVARYQLNSLRTEALQERIISLGLEMGIRYHLQ